MKSRSRLLMIATAALTVVAISAVTVVNANAGTAPAKAPSATAAHVSQIPRGTTGALVFPGSNGAAGPRCEVQEYYPDVYVDLGMLGHILISCPEAPYEMTVTVSLLKSNVLFEERSTKTETAPIGTATFDFYTEPFGCYSGLFATYAYITVRFADGDTRTREYLTDNVEVLC